MILDCKIYISNIQITDASMYKYTYLYFFPLLIILFSSLMSLCFSVQLQPFKDLLCWMLVLHIIDRSFHTESSG